jgi:hypothetical protein
LGALDCDGRGTLSTGKGSVTGNESFVLPASLFKLADRLLFALGAIVYFLMCIHIEGSRIIALDD